MFERLHPPTDDSGSATATYFHQYPLRAGPFAVLSAHSKLAPLTPEVVPVLARQALVKRLIAVHIPFAAVHVAWLKKLGPQGGYSQRISEVVRPSSQRRSLESQAADGSVTKLGSLYLLRTAFRPPRQRVRPGQAPSPSQLELGSRQAGQAVSAPCKKTDSGRVYIRQCCKPQPPRCSRSNVCWLIS